MVLHFDSNDGFDELAVVINLLIIVSDFWFRTGGTVSSLGTSVHSGSYGPAVDKRCWE